LKLGNKLANGTVPVISFNNLVVILLADFQSKLTAVTAIYHNILANVTIEPHKS